MVGVKYTIFVRDRTSLVKRNAFASGYIAYAGVSFYVQKGITYYQNRSRGQFSVSE